ncbi:hypothetical protein B0H19DRAFT_1072068 [Mycena capillaripes]|nr:hypothetical protein B0H19DRAFT_1072068 [Mycena capillaripes]
MPRRGTKDDNESSATNVGTRLSGPRSTVTLCGFQPESIHFAMMREPYQNLDREVNAGKGFTSDLHFQLELNRKRTLLEAESSAQSVRSVFECLETFSMGSLLVLAQAYCIRLGKSVTPEDLRSGIMHHLGTGSCTILEGYYSYPACSSVESQFAQFTVQPGTPEDPAARL